MLEPIIITNKAFTKAHGQHNRFNPEHPDADAAYTWNLSSVIDHMLEHPQQA